MINKFEKQLEKWNHGVLRGAQAKLAKCLHVSTATVALWATGKRHPSKGYIHQLGKIFGLDDYTVSRLFLPALSTSFPSWTAATTGLHDSNDHSVTYSADNFLYTSQIKNSISLPFFTHLPSNLPAYQQTQVAEWWTLPRRITQGAQFLIPAKQTDLPLCLADDILLITPTTEWTAGKWMLAQKSGKYLIRRIVQGKKGLKWQKKGSAATLISSHAKPIGIVVGKLTNIIF